MKAHEVFMQEMHAKHGRDCPPGPECPECMSEVIQSIVIRLNDGDSKFDQITKMIGTNTRITVENSETLREVRDVVEMGRALFKLAGYVGRAAKWVAGIAGAVLGVAGIKEIIDKVSK